MILAAALAALLGPSSFLIDFGGVWTCGNANYHERWDIHPLAGRAEITEVVYGDPAKPDGYAFVYFVPEEHVFRYDDFHADGAQSHLTGFPTNAVWEWTGNYEPKGGPVDTSPDITWTRHNDMIERSFGQRVKGTALARGSDTCTKVWT